MKTRLETLGLFVAYQLSLLTGLLLLPIAILARHVGITIPIHRLIDPVHDAYQSR